MIKKIIVFFCLFLTQIIVSTEVEKYRLSLSLYNDGFTEIAEKSFTEFLTDYPASIYRNKALYYLSLSQIKLNKSSEAVKNLSLLTTEKKFEFYQDALYYLTLNLFIIGNYKESEKYLTEIYYKEETPIRREKLLYISIINNINLNNIKLSLEKSKQYFDNINFVNYRYDIQKYLLNYYVSIDDYYNASQICELLFKENRILPSDKSIIYFNYLLSLSSLKKYSDCVDFFDKYIDYYEEKLFLLMSNVNYELKNIKKSIYYLEEVVNKNDDNQLLKRIAVLYVELNELNNAISYLEKHQKKGDEINQLLGDLYYRKNNYQKSYQYFKSVKIDKLNLSNFLIFFNVIVHLEKKDDIILYYNYLDIIATIGKKERNNILYKISETFYNIKDYSRCEKILELWLNEFVNDELYDKILFMKAQTLKNNKKYDLALVELSKLQKLKKMNMVYYESFSEKGELYFQLREYHSAIENYKLYLSNKKYLSREREVELQLGNSYYNIKDYKNSFDTYKNYAERYGESVEIFVKIGNSLLKAERYQDIVNYFSDKKNIGNHCNYLVHFANYKLGNKEMMAIDEKIINTNKNSEYFIDMIYLTVLNRNESRNFNGIKDEYNRIETILQKDIDTEKTIQIMREYYKAFVRIGELTFAKKVFKNQNLTLLFFQGATLFNTLYLDEAKYYFMEIINKNYFFDLIENELEIIADYFDKIYDFSQSGKIYQHLFDQNTTTKFLLKAFESSFYLNDALACKNLYENSKDKSLTDYFDISIEYIENKNRDKYKKGLLNILKSKKIDSVLSKEILLKYLKFEYDDKNYNEILKFVSKISDRDFSNLSPQIKFIQASSYNYLGDDKNALSEYLKIYYLYSYSPYWVEKSIKEIINIYRKNGEEEKIEKTIQMFEEKYFKMR